MAEKETSTSQSASPVRGGSKKWFILIGFVLLCVALFAAYVWFTLNWSYDTGERAGVVQKFSSKGWICKTWEGELEVVTTIAGSKPEKFYFTVRDEAVVEKVRAAVGKRADVTFEHHRGLVSSCFGDTAQFVTGIKVIDP